MRRRRKTETEIKEIGGKGGKYLEKADIFLRRRRKRRRLFRDVLQC